VCAIVESCPPRRTLLFSATMPEPVRKLARSIQTDAVEVLCDERVETLRQLAYRCERGGRNALAAAVLALHRPSRALVFCETKRDCDGLARFLSGRGAHALALHGDLEQRDRDDALVQFANGSATVLVATNVAARGLDIPELPLVLIAELSRDVDAHVHRVGRTARAGAEGVAACLVEGPGELNRLHRIEQATGTKLERAETPTGGALGFLRPTHRTLLLLAGRQDKLRKGDVLGALIQDARVPADALGRIDVNRATIAVAVRLDHAESALAWAREGRIKKKRVRARLLGRSVSPGR
ncbi:MAG TPA: helicase-related protein, partial [Myxococcota bacterium]|nr:helicase-related protein [Myxococcota bacterium]